MATLCVASTLSSKAQTVSSNQILLLNVPFSLFFLNLEFIDVSVLVGLQYYFLLNIGSFFLSSVQSIFKSHFAICYVSVCCKFTLFLLFCCSYDDMPTTSALYLHLTLLLRQPQSNWRLLIQVRMLCNCCSLCLEHYNFDSDYM